MSAPLCLYYRVIQLISYLFKELLDLLNELFQKLVTLDFNAKELLMLKSLRAKVANFFFKELRVYVLKAIIKCI